MNNSANWTTVALQTGLDYCIMTKNLVIWLKIYALTNFKITSWEKAFGLGKIGGSQDRKSWNV